jgi:hypothetical protein
MWTKAWQDERPGWTRRVRWYPQQDGTVRLLFEERNADNTDRKKYRVIVSSERAESLFELYSTHPDSKGLEIYVDERIREELQ